MYYIVSVVLYLIVTFWIIKKRNMSSKASTISLIIFIIAAIIGIISGIQPTQEYLKTVDNQTIVAILLVMIVIGIIVIPLIFSILIWRGTDLFVQLFRKTHLSVTLLDSSKLYLGGELLFDAKISGFFSNGYFKIKIRSPYDEEEIITSRYDGTKKRGKLRMDYKNQVMKIKSHIPKTFSSGEYDVIIEIHDVIVWLFSIRTTRKLKTEKLRVTINESIT